jgi:hypothetical protein
MLYKCALVGPYAGLVVASILETMFCLFPEAGMGAVVPYGAEVTLGIIILAALYCYVMVGVGCFVCCAAI